MDSLSLPPPGNSTDSLVAWRQPSSAGAPGLDARIEEAEARTEQAEIRIEQAELRTEKAEVRIEQAKVRTEKAEARTEQTEVRIAEAETRIEQAETRSEQAKTRTEQAKARTEQAEMRTEQAEARSEQAETRSEQAVRDSEVSYRRLFEAAKDGILILDVETGRINDVNPFLIELLGFSRREMLGKTVGELSPFTDIEDNQAMLERLQKFGFARYEDLPLQARDGRKMAVEFVSNMYEAGGIKVIQCNIRDITQRKEAEIATLRLAAIVESSDDAIIGKDLCGVVTSWNKGAEKIFGYLASEMMGASIMRLIPADRQEEEQDQILGKIKCGESVDHFETVRQTKDGRLISVSITVSPIKDATGAVIGASKVARDITGRRQAEDKILQLNAELEERVLERTAQLEAANKDLESFSYSVSHDLRAPLRAIGGFSRIVLEDHSAAMDADGLRYLHLVEKSAQQMGQLIDDLLTFSRTGRQALNVQPVITADVVNAALDDLKAMQENRRVNISVGALADCEADPSLLRQVWLNLLSNALKYTRKRDSAVITIGSRREGEMDVFFVQDNGAGFDMKYADKLFGVFQRLHLADDYEGTGVGLALVQRIVQRHGGKVWAEAKLNLGATFHFTLTGGQDAA
jgi:PAS domain S-box-containing protein